MGCVTHSGVTHGCFCFSSCIDATGFFLPEKSLSSLSPGPLATLCTEAGPGAPMGSHLASAFPQIQAGPSVRLQLW